MLINVLRMSGVFKEYGVLVPPPVGGPISRRLCFRAASIFSVCILQIQGNRKDVKWLNDLISFPCITLEEQFEFKYTFFILHYFCYLTVNMSNFLKQSIHINTYIYFILDSLSSDLELVILENPHKTINLSNENISINGNETHFYKQKLVYIIQSPKAN